jgi:hypothetical protein
MSDGNVTEHGSTDLSRAIQEIGRSAFRSPGFSDVTKHAIALQLDFLASEAVQPKGQRRAAIIHPVLNGLQSVLGTSVDMQQAWSTWGPTLLEFFRRAQSGSSFARDSPSS